MAALPARIVSTDEVGTILATFVPSSSHKTGRRRSDDKEDHHVRIDVIKPGPGLRSLTQTLASLFLPTGYPHSVTADYLAYQTYDSLQAFTSSIAGLLSSRAVLSTIGVGDAAASPTLAILLSILQDSLGRVTTILFAHRLGTALEPECKMFRLLADVFNDAAMVLECLSPAFPRTGRVLVLATAAALKALCGVAAGSSKASLSAHFARRGNLAELNAKDSSQETVVSLVGMMAGAVVVRHVREGWATWTCLLGLLAAHLWLNWMAVRSVTMRTLNRQRAGMVFSHWAATGTVLSPEQVRDRERVFERNGVVRGRDGEVLGHASIGVPFEQLLSQVAVPTTGGSHAFHVHHSFVDAIGDDEHAARRGYIAHLDVGSRHCFIALGKSSTVQDQLKAWFTACQALERLGASKDVKTSDLMAEAHECADSEYSSLEKMMADTGWDLSTGALETRRGIRYSRANQDKRIATGADC